MAPSRLRAPRASIAWTYRSKGYIWRIIPYGTGILTGEERDPVAKTVRIFCLDAATGERLWMTSAEFSTWWESIEAVHGGVLFLHEFPRPDMPDHGKIRALDLEDGRLLWSEPQLAFAFAAGTDVFATKDFFDRRRFYRLDLRTGEQRGEVGMDVVTAARDSISHGSPGEIRLPLPSGGVPDPLGRSAEIHPEGSAKLELGHADVWSYYDLASGGGGDTRRLLTHRIAVVSEGRVLFEDVIGRALNVPVPEAFFQLGTKIYYVKEKRDLIALEVEAEVQP